MQKFPCNTSLWFSYFCFFYSVDKVFYMVFCGCLCLLVYIYIMVVFVIVFFINKVLEIQSFTKNNCYLPLDFLCTDPPTLKKWFCYPSNMVFDQKFPYKTVSECQGWRDGQTQRQTSQLTDSIGQGAC